MSDNVRTLRRAAKALLRVVRLRRRLRQAGRPVLWLMLTPAPRMGNLGDDAQAIAVERWLQARFETEPLELDRDEYRSLARMLGWVIRRDELILVQSGGNMGDRGWQAEALRRRIVSDFERNRVISLPQTIFFSDTPSGRKEAETSARIYGQHPALDIVARDAVSLRIGAELFGSACHSMAPDLVLQMAGPPRDGDRSGVVLAFRGDKERRLTAAQHRAIESSLEGWSITRTDTVVDFPVRRAQRERIVSEIIDRFARHRLVITDRFHGMAFALVADTPCIVLEAADHKIRAGMAWLEGCPSVQLVPDDEPLGPVIEKVLAAPSPATCRRADDRLDRAWSELEELVRLRLAERARS